MTSFDYGAKKARDVGLAQGSTNYAHGDERARKEIFACTNLRARKSNKTPLSSTPMLYKVLSFFLCVEANNIWYNTI